MGIEADANRPGYNRLRVEPWHHFYNDEVIMYCRNINKIKRTLYEKEIYSSFQFGYQKWEAEQYNGLDEFLTKRNYRTTLKQINNKLAKLSAFVFSGYAMEITRRIGNNNSKDWRYDKDVFGICITREIRVHTIFNSIDNTIKIFLNGNTYPTIPGTFDITGTLFNNTTYTRSFTNDMVEVDGDTFILTFGVVEIVVDEENYTTQIINFLFFPRLSVELGNVINAVNIIEPGTLYNYRRSPVRNAMRWLNKILASYRVFGINAKIIFTDGDGNYFAEGEMESVRCKLENAAIKENATLSRTNFIDANEARPSLRPERVVYEYPMNSCEYKAIKANPNGLIYFEDECEHGFGYIDTLVHRPKEAMANFTLIPAVKSVELLTGCNVPTGLQVVNILPSVVIPGYWNVQIEFDTVTPTPAGGYDWELDENPVTGVIQSGNTSNAGAIQSFTIADVANGGSWQVRIRSNCGSGAYSAWAIINFTTP